MWSAIKASRVLDATQRRLRELAFKLMHLHIYASTKQITWILTVQSLLPL
jgi:hypothetical protein